jgi:hypothetical protein
MAETLADELAAAGIVGDPADKGPRLRRIPGFPIAGSAQRDHNLSRVPQPLGH